MRARIPDLHLSPSMAVALVALFVALGGSAVAVSGRINGKVIKRGSVPGNRIKKDTLTGRQIREARLGMVPQAALATVATNATRADRADKLGPFTPADFQRAGTVIPFDVRMANTDPDQALVQAGPFTVHGSCTTNAGQNVNKVLVTTSENDAAVVSTDMFGTEHRDNDFDVGDSFQATGYQESGTPPPPPNGPFQSTGEMFSRGGVSLTYFVAQGNHLFSANPSEQSSCTLAGFAVVGRR
jgi:hypothetical protein